MASYTVTSSNFAPFPEGATVTEDELDGCDIAALVAGGHLAPTGDAAEKSSSTTTARPAQTPAAPPDPAATADSTKEQ